MEQSFLLLNSGDFVLLNSGDKVLLNGDVGGVGIVGTHATELIGRGRVQRRKRKQFELEATARISRSSLLTASAKLEKIFELYATGKLFRTLELFATGRITRLYEKVASGQTYQKIKRLYTLTASSDVFDKDESKKIEEFVDRQSKGIKLSKLRKLFKIYKDEDE